MTLMKNVFLKDSNIRMTLMKTVLLKDSDIRMTLMKTVLLKEQSTRTILIPFGHLKGVTTGKTPMLPFIPNECNTRHDKVSSALLKGPTKQPPKGALQHGDHKL